MRSNEYLVARDNVLFEAGMFMGMHGKSRAFVLTPRNSPNFHVPTDLAGFTTATYDPSDAKINPGSAVSGPVHAIEQAMDAMLLSQDSLEIRAWAAHDPNATWPLKIWMKIANRKSVAVAVDSLTFEYRSALRPPAGESILDEVMHRPAFKIGSEKHRDSAGIKRDRDIYRASCLLQPGQIIDAWIAFDPTIGFDDLKASLAEKKAGTWQFRCIWQYPAPRYTLLEHLF
jgi:Predicted nucleotide-binding protein containing TIR-like domain